MFDAVAEKVARTYQGVSKDPAIAKLDWASILAIVMELLQVLLPLLEEWCPVEAENIRKRAKSMRPLIGLKPLQRWRYPILDRWCYLRFQSIVKRGLGPVDEIIDQDEIETAMLDVAVILTDDEIMQTKAEIKRDY